jgi:hypothetical protein
MPIKQEVRFYAPSPNGSESSAMDRSGTAFASASLDFVSGTSEMRDP